MRILCLSDRYWPALGGIETGVRLVSQLMSDRGHRVQVVTASNRQPGLTFATYTYAAPSPEEYRDGDMAVRLLGARPWQRLAQLPVAIRYAPYLRGRAFGKLAELTLPAFLLAHERTMTAFARRSDIVHCHGAQYLGAAGIRAARKAGIPFAITPHCHPGHWGDDPMNVATYRAADLVVAVSEADAETYRKLGVDDARIEVIRDPVPFESTTAPHREAEPYVLFLGRVNTYKGVRALFEAWPLVRCSISARLLVAGPVQETDLDPPEGVTLLGPVSEERKAGLLSGAVALALPSRGELLGIVLMEAWRHGVPVVVSDIPALAGLVTHGVDGLVTETDPEALSAALLRLLEDPDLARRMGEAGRAGVGAEHDPGLVTERTLAAYERLLRGGSRLKRTAEVLR